MLLEWLAALALAAWLGVLLLPSRSWSTRERLALASGQDVPGNLQDLSAISVLIPARNEAGQIGSTLRALARQGVNLEAIVVDDQSTDGTGGAARGAVPGNDEFLTTRIVPGAPLPEGWGGKLWALEQGRGQLKRKYCLLLDAEIELAPGVAASLLYKAESESLAMVSIMAELRCVSFWERLLVPPFIFFFKLIYPFSKVNEPRFKTAAAAGGCILIRTNVLNEIGGFAAIRTALIDDCTLAARVKSAGLAIWIGLSHAVTSQRSYPTLESFRRMVRRTAFTQLRYSYLLLTLVIALLLLVFVVPWLALLAGPDAPARAIGAAALLSMTTAYLPTVRFYRLPAICALSLPLAALFFLSMTIESAWRYLRGVRAEWKGRTYETTGGNKPR